MTPAEHLRAAKARISNPKNWTQSGSFAVTERGRPIGWGTDNACAWCSVGAVFAVGEGAEGDAEAAALSALRDVGLSTHWNDAPSTTHAMVMAKFDEAIEALA